MADTDTATTVYSTSSSGETNFDKLSPELFDELELEPKDDTPDDFYAHHDEGDYEYFGNYYPKEEPTMPVLSDQGYIEANLDLGLYDSWCEICEEAADHFGLHNTLVAEGIALYGIGTSYGMVYRLRLGV